MSEVRRILFGCRAGYCEWTQVSRDPYETIFDAGGYPARFKMKQVLKCRRCGTTTTMKEQDAVSEIRLKLWLD